MTTSSPSQDSRNSADHDMKTDYVLLGNINAGKTTLFDCLAPSRLTDIDIPGTAVSIRVGKVPGTESLLYDTPEIYSIFSSNEEERASRDILLLPETGSKIKGIVLVADAKNLKRAIAISLQLAEYKIPMIMDINMIDEASSRGIDIDFQRLSEILGIEIVTTIAREGIGIAKLKTLLRHIKPPKQITAYPESIEEFIGLVEKLLPESDISGRALSLLLLSGDRSVETYLTESCGKVILEQLKHIAKEYRSEHSVSIEILLENLYHRQAASIAAEVLTVEPPTRNPFITTFGDMCTKISTGIPIAAAVTAVLYLFVGKFAATFLVDAINTNLFQKILIPSITGYLQIIPSSFIRDLIIDPDFGVLPTGLFLAIGLVMPVIFCFYIAFGVLEDSGYLPRLSVLLNRVFRKIGLNGKGVIPLVMGFSCITMALLTTRMLHSNKEKNIASFLIFLCMPCAPLIAVMLVILDKMPLAATITVFGMILSQILIAGMLANRIVSGEHGSFIMEIPAMRIPKAWVVLKMAAKKTNHFMREAVPVFIYASAAIFIFQRAGGLAMLEKYAGPLIHETLGLPEQSIQVFIKTMIRRESGAAELEHLRHQYTNLQMVVNLVVMTFIVPCINSIIVLFKERGMKSASIIMATVVCYSLLIGSIINYTCMAFGITFS